MPRASTAFTPNTTHGGQPRSRGAPVATTIASSVRCRRSISRSSSAICCSEMAGKRGRSGRIGVTSAIGVQNKLLDLGIFGPTHSREFGPFGILGPTYFLVGSYKETPSRPGHQGVGSAPPEPRRAARRAVIIARERALTQARVHEGRKRAVAAGVKFGPKFKLDTFQKREALSRLQAGESLSLVARTYGVDTSTIWRLQKRAEIMKEGTP